MLTDSRDDAWVRAQIARLPGSAVAELQAGPAEHPACQVCTVLKPLEDGPPPARRDPANTGDPVTDLLDYHAVEAIPGESEQVARAVYGSESYRRCIQIYRCAGWADGDG